MRLLRSFLLLVTTLFASVFGAHPSAIEVKLWIPDGSDWNPYFYELISGNPSYLLAFDGATKLPTQWTVGSGLSVTSGVLNCTVAAPAALSFATPSRSRDSAFQISSTRSAQVFYSVDVSITSLLATTMGSIQLQYADNSGMSTNVVNLMTSKSQFGGVLNIAAVQTVMVSGIIPAGKYVRIVTGSTGSPGYGTLIAQEVLGQ